MKLILDRPLVFFDIESTGLNRKTDRIIDLALIKLHPDASRISIEFRVNPGIPISPSSTAIHGITDDDVKGCSLFKSVAQEVADFLKGCDLSGYNLLHFDIPMLEEEFLRAGVQIDLKACHVVDAQKIFHKKEPRDLTAALRFYCHKELKNAHGAMPDTEAVLDVLEGQCERYEDLPCTVPELSAFCSPPDARFVDREGKLCWDENGQIAINFGQNKGKSLRLLAKKNKTYLEWIMRKDFPRDMQDKVRDALNGIFHTET